MTGLSGLRPVTGTGLSWLWSVTGLGGIRYVTGLSFGTGQLILGREMFQNEIASPKLVQIHAPNGFVHRIEIVEVDETHLFVVVVLVSDHSARDYVTEADEQLPQISFAGRCVQ